MGRRLFLHIGAHKTATTTIQRAFHRGRAALARKGVLYPEAGRFYLGQHRLAFALKGRPDPDRGDVPDFDAEMAALRAEVLAAPQQTVFVSSEEFFTLGADRIRRLVDAVDFAELHVVAVVRRQDDFLLSLYNQHAKAVGNGFTRPLEHYVADPRGISREISFLGWVTKWRRGVGKDRVLLRRYEDAEPVAAMLEILELPRKALPRPAGRANESLPAAAVEAIRLAKLADLSPALQENVAKIARKVFAGGAKQELSPADRRRILEVFAEENATLFARFGMDNTYGPEAVAPPSGAAAP